MRFFGRTCVCLLALLWAHPRPAQAQEFTGGWQPIGPVPVDQAGAGRRGYAMPGEDAGILGAKTNQISIHMVGANNFYIEKSNAFEISQRSETHSLAFDYRRGFKAGKLPFELGMQFQISETDEGMLNGFISGFEDMVNRPLRSKTAAPPLGVSISRDGRPLYRDAGQGSGIGDVYFVAKAALHDADPTSRGARVSARIAVNISGASQFTEGNYIGMGLSLDKKLANWVALHGDVRTNVILDTVSTWGLPLSRGVFAFSLGPEMKITQNTSLNLQWDGSSSPYQPAGVTALDVAYGDAVLGVNRRFFTGNRVVLTQFYMRENMVLPFSVRWNADPDLAVGFKVTIR